MIDFVRKRLSHKIMIAIIIGISVVMTVEIAVRVYFGTKDRMEIFTNLSRELAVSIYAGIKNPMSRGDGEAVQEQLVHIGEHKKEVEVFICDSDQEVIYSTHKNKLKTIAADSISNRQSIETLSAALETGIEPTEMLEDQVGGRRCLLTIQPVLNQSECHHCHGWSKRVLGCVIMRLDVEGAYGTVAAARNRTIFLGIIGILSIIMVVYAMLTRFVGRPVENLAKKARRLAEGDMSVSVQVDTEDEIGVLGNTFNSMVESISSFSRRLEQEVTRKTTLLHERSQLIAMLERSNEKMRELDQLKSTFLANTSHELRTPMNAIIGYTDLLLEGIDGPINQEQERSLRRVSFNARHLLGLINDILDLSKIESGITELMPRETDLGSLIESVIPAVEPLVAQKGLTLAVNIDKELPPVYVDPDKVSHILMNLLSNAIKFTHQGGITVSVRPSDRGIKAGEPPIFAEVCVADTGIGIKEEELGRIFDKFVQADLSLVRQHEGTGLGLSIARGLTGLHKGVIWATSKPGEGSRFYFTLPFQKEMLERPAEPIVEHTMAEGLAEHFGVPVETFLGQAQYAGRPVRCWEYLHCGQPTCPAYGKETPCWLVLGTQCAGMKTAAYPEKLDVCKRCEVIKTLVLKQETVGTPPPAEGGDAGKRTVLAIDDNEEAIDLIRKYLGGDYNVVGLLSGQDAVERAKALKPLAITLDIMMPEKDGWEVLRELKNTPETQDIPVIVVTIVDNKRLGLSLGAAEYILKPVDRQALLQKIKHIDKSAKIRRVLIVDQDEQTARLCHNYIDEFGYEAKIAINGRQAIESIKQSKPDLIVLNITVPETEGFDLITYIKTDENAKDIPLIIVSTRDLTREEMESLNGRIKGIWDKRILQGNNFQLELKDMLTKMTEQ